MRDKQFIRTVIVVFAIFIIMGRTTDAQLPSEGVRLSFYGYDLEAIGFLDASVSDTIRLWHAETVGPEVEGSPYYFGFFSKAHGNVGYEDLPDTRIDCSQVPCTDCDYQITATFVGPGIGLVIGDVRGGCCDQEATLTGSQWQGFKPNDFTHIRVEVDAQPPLAACPEEYLIKIKWIKIQVPVKTTSWGILKSTYLTD
jgi:hypothetical protein